MWQSRQEKVARGYEVCIEDGDKLPLSLIQRIGQRTGFKTCPISTMECLDHYPALAPKIDSPLDQGGRAIVRVVQDLHLETVARVLQPRTGRDQPLDHMAFVIDGELDGDTRGNGRQRRDGKRAAGAPPVLHGQPKRIESIDRQAEQTEQVEQLQQER
jgi:hypothetical protein